MSNQNDSLVKRQMLLEANSSLDGQMMTMGNSNEQRQMSSANDSMVKRKTSIEAINHFELMTAYIKKNNVICQVIGSE